MTNQTNIHNEELNQEELNNESKTPEISKSQDIESNFDSELNIKNGKNELLQELQESNAAMKAEIEKITKIAATSQSQYITLKNEFDSYIRRIDSEKKEIKIAELQKIVGKFSKLLEQIRLFLSHLDQNLIENEQIKGLQLIYGSFIKQELSQMGVFQIESLGLIPNPEFHEILLIQASTEEDIKNLESQSIVINGKKENFTLEDLKGIIISELEVGYYYSDGEKRVIIKPSKVVVGE